MFNVNQWILWVAVLSTSRPGKTDKFPIDYRTNKICNAHDPAVWMDYQTAKALQASAPALHPQQTGTGVGFVLTENDPFFFLDIDACLTPQGWNDTAKNILTWFPGAFVEVSQSGTGLHVVGSYTSIPPHSCRNAAYNLEFYSSGRFIAVSETHAQGDPHKDQTDILPQFILNFFTARTNTGSPSEWTTVPVPEWKGPEEDEKLIELACKTRTATSAFGYKASFQNLWTGDATSLGKFFPDDTGKGRQFNESDADMSLAQHLAFWTGKNCERIATLMWKSGLVRGKWRDRNDYLHGTILKAVGGQKDVFGSAPRLKAQSEKQREFGNTIREKILNSATPEERAALTAGQGPTATAKFWIENSDKSASDIAVMMKPAAAPSSHLSAQVEVVSGYQFMSADMQMEHFKGCVYVQDIHEVMTGNGDLLNQDRFNVTYGGYIFQLDEMGDKTTRKAWEAFTESQIIRHPKVNTTCFRPTEEPGKIIDRCGSTMVNTYFPVNTPRRAGDPSRFVDHLKKLIPDERDQKILLSYFAACLQYPGKKFFWAPLIQGAEGNGKSLFTECVAFAVGEKYCHLPPANEIHEKFNEWLFYKLLIGVEDIYVPESKQMVIEVLKPMITGGRLAMRAMRKSQVMGDNVAHFIINSNWKDAVRKTGNDRRFAIFYCAQQTKGDIIKSGMGGMYFPNLYRWLREEGGFEIVSEFLHTYPIEPEFNPAEACHRAPKTSSEQEAVSLSFGGVEQYILEAADEGRQGFCGDWISSVALEKLLVQVRKNNSIPHNKRRELLESMGYYWHPALDQGRVNNPVMIDDGKKPRLFIKKGHKCENIMTPVDVVNAYIKAQTEGE